MADPLPPAVSILVVAYNSRRCIAECLASVSAGAKTATYETLLIDNGDDGSEALVGREFPDVRIMPGCGNIGFGPAVNRLAAQARGQYLLLLNPDVVVEPGAIDALVWAASEDTGVAAWGGVTLGVSGEPDSGNFVSIPTLRGLLRGVSGHGDPALSGAAMSAVPSGGFVLIDRAAWAQAGGFDEEYFLYSEEIDLFYRLARERWGLRRVTAARARHDIAHGGGLAQRRLLFMAAGRAEFLRKHWSAPARWTGVLLIWLAALVRVVAGLFGGRWNRHWRGLGQGYRGVAFHPRLWMHGYDPRRGLSRQWNLVR